MISFLMDSIALSILLVCASLIFFGLLAFFIFRKMKPKTNDKQPIIDFDQWVDAFGGIDNIISVSCTISRLTIFYRYENKIDMEKIKALKPFSTMLMSDKLIVVTNFGKLIESYINSKL